MKPSHRLTAAVLVLASVVAPVRGQAQSLRGSHASVNLMYRRALRGGLDFYETSSQVKRAVLRGELVALGGNANYDVHNIKTPYVRPETKSFVLSLAKEYRRTCGEEMVVTSAVRPMSRKLVNSSSMTVHPTGMAVDLRKPSGRCLTWLRRTLLNAERRGEIEATEERRPPHFHVAVLPGRVQRVAATPVRSRAQRAKADDN